MSKEGIIASRADVWKLLKKNKELEIHIQRKPGSGRCTEVSRSVKKIFDGTLEEDDERTGISKILEQNGYNLNGAAV